MKISLSVFVLLAFGIQTETVAEDEEKPIRLRVLCYNIHHAEGVDRKLDVERIARVIRAANPDLVALQEVDQKVQRTGKVDQPTELARLTKLHVAFGANIPLQGGQYGNAVLSKFPIVRHKNHLLPNVDNGEQRGVLEVAVRLPGTDRPLAVYCTHFDHRGDRTERVKSARAINDLVKNESHAAVLAGDLNDVIGSEPLTILDREWIRPSTVPQPTIPVTKPTRQIDFILVRPDGRWTVVETRVLDEAVASDHRAIFSVLELRPDTIDATD